MHGVNGAGRSRGELGEESLWVWVGGRSGSEEKSAEGAMAKAQEVNLHAFPAQHTAALYVLVVQALHTVSLPQCSLARPSPAQHRTAQHSTAQHSTAQHSTGVLHDCLQLVEEDHSHPMYETTKQTMVSQLRRVQVKKAQLFKPCKVQRGF